MKNNINIHEYDKKINVASNSRDTSSDVANTLMRKYFQPKSLNTLLPLIKKDPIEYGSELTNWDIKKINKILTETRRYFYDLNSEIGQEYKFIGEMDINKEYVDIAKKCIQFLKSNNNFKSYREFNEKHATISDFNFYVNWASKTIKEIETKNWTISNFWFTLIYRIVLLVISYLDSTIEPEKPPKQAEASLPIPPTPPKKAAAAQEMPPFEPDKKESGYKPYKPYKPGTGGKIELY